MRLFGHCVCVSYRVLVRFALSMFAPVKFALFRYALFRFAIVTGRGRLRPGLPR